MNILCIFPAFRPPGHAAPVGGGEISNRQLLEELSSRGHSVNVYAFNAGAGVGSHAPGISVIDGGLGRSRVLGKVGTYIRSKRDLLGAVSRSVPDIVLTSTGTVGFALRLAEQWKAPVAVFVRAERDMQGSISRGALKNVGKRLLFGSSHWSAAPFLIANSRYILDLCGHKGYRGQGWIVYPPVEVEVSERTWPTAVRTVGMIGSSKQKGIEIFLELARLLPETKFVVIGDRSVPANKTAVSGNVTRMGWTNNPIEAIDACDAILMPTAFDEAFGRVAVEAVLRKKFAMVSRIGGLPEAVGDERLLVEPTDLDSWHRRVSDLISDPQSYFPAMESALLNAVSFGLGTQADRLEEICFEMQRRKLSGDS